MKPDDFPFLPQYRSFLFRIPGRDYRTQVTHKTWDQMNRHERRLVAKDTDNAAIRAKIGEHGNG